jgi:hypothetical protein
MGTVAEAGAEGPPGDSWVPPIALWRRKELKGTEQRRKEGEDKEEDWARGY